ILTTDRRRASRTRDAGRTGNGRQMNALPSPITLTEAAARQVRDIIAGSDKPVIGVRIGISTKGCNGLSYTLNYAEKAEPMDMKVEDKGVTVLIDPKASLYLIG